MYTDKTLDDVRNADVVKVISHYENLKKAGSLYECNSPFSDDKTPSFKVKQSTNRWTCYSTNQGGDALAFVMLKNSCPFPEAVKTVAEICGIILEEEKVTEETKRKRKDRQTIKDILNNVAKGYAKQLSDLAPEHWAKQFITDREITQETIINFGLGYAPDEWKFLTNAVIDKGVFSSAKAAGLVSVKDGNSYDFFKNRFMFPIHDINGNVIGFGGRCAPDDPNAASGKKYINSKETAVYSKSKSLYGIFQAKHAIVKSKTALLVEGYTDVTALHQAGVNIAVASGGTALTDDQALILKRLTPHVIISRDNDGFDDKGNVKAGLKAALNDVNILLGHGLKVSIVVFPEGEDPDSYSRKHENIKEFINENLTDAVEWKTQFLFNQAANDPDALSGCVTQVAKMLFCIKDDVKRNSYVNICKKILKQPVKVLKDKLAELYNQALERAKSQVSNETTAQDLGLPAGADFEEFKRFRFCSIGSACWFQGRGGNFFKGTNYKIEPLFHIDGNVDNKRLCEIINEVGTKRLIDFDSSDFVSRAKFEERLINEGFFVHFENFSAKEFTLLKNRVLSDFITAHPLKTLGWQKEGFFAFADCVFNNQTIKRVDKYGIVQLDGLETINSDYKDDVKHYYSPAFSEIYKHTRDDDDPYENDRSFVYKESPITLKTWLEQLLKVYGQQKTINGIGFIFATVFRDIFLRRYQFFPHLFLSGEKGSGKTKYAESLAALFTYKQEPYDLNAGTLVAFYRRLSRITNAPTILEEFHDNIDDKMFQGIKGAYDGRGREMGKATGDNRTTTTKVNSSLIILSQYLSARDDNSNTSRSIIEHFIKPQEQFTNAQIENYNLLKSWEEQGLSSMLLDIVKHRPLIEKNVHKTYAELNKKLKHDLKNTEYQERMLQNYVCMLTILKILWPEFKFPFSYDDVYTQYKEAIIDSSDQIVESEGLQNFWRILEYLRDREPFALLKENYHYKLDTPPTISLQTRKGQPSLEWKNNERAEIMYLRLNAVHQLYHKEVSTRENEAVITESTLRNYFKSKKYFIGSVKSVWFENQNTSAYVFNYTMMREAGILNITRGSELDAPKATASQKPSNNQAGDDNDELPF